MIFRFTPVPVRGDGPSGIRWRPILSVGLAPPGGSPRQYIPCVLDTGADDVLVPVQYARELGLDIRAAPRSTVTVASGQRLTVAYVPVELTLVASANHYVRWVATVGFARVSRGLFGVAGGLQFFHTTVDVMAARVWMTPYPTIPATDLRLPTPEQAAQVRL